MFTERKVICVFLVIFLFLPLININKDKTTIIPWIVCSSLLFIFPFLSVKIEDSILFM